MYAKGQPGIRVAFAIALKRDLTSAVLIHLGLAPSTPNEESDQQILRVLGLEIRTERESPAMGRKVVSMLRRNAMSVEKKLG